MLPSKFLTMRLKTFLSWKENASCWPTVNTWFENWIVKSRAICSESYGSNEVLKYQDKIRHLTTGLV